MTYLPPFARMRQIKAKAPAPISKHPQNVAEAIADAQERQMGGEVVEEVVVEVEEDLFVEVTAGEDGLFGTDDDVVTDIHKHDEDGEHIQPQFSMAMKKAELLEVAEEMGVLINTGMTKKQIINALKAAPG